MSAKKPPRSDGRGAPVGAPPPGATGALVAIGRVGRPHGLRGAFFVSGRDEPVPYREVLIGTAPTGAVRTAIKASQLQGGRPLVTCSLASDRNAAAALVGQVIFAERSLVEAAARAAGAVLWADLAGVAVVDVKGAVMGRVHHVYNAGASDVAHVRDGERSVDVPLVEAYVDLTRPISGSRPLTLVLKVEATVFAAVWDDQTRRTGPEGDA